MPVPIVAMIAAEFAATGSESTRRFHGLSAGNNAQPATRAVGGAAEEERRGDAPRAAERAVTTAPPGSGRGG